MIIESNFEKIEEPALTENTVGQIGRHIWHKAGFDIECPTANTDCNRMEIIMQSTAGYAGNSQFLPFSHINIQQLTEISGKYIQISAGIDQCLISNNRPIAQELNRYHRSQHIRTQFFVMELHTRPTYAPSLVGIRVRIGTACPFRCAFCIASLAVLPLAMTLRSSSANATHKPLNRR